MVKTDLKMKAQICCVIMLFLLMSLAPAAAGARLIKRNNIITQQICAFIFKSVFTILVFFDTALQAVAWLGGIFVQRSLGCQAPTAESCIHDSIGMT